MAGARCERQPLQKDPERQRRRRLPAVQEEKEEEESRAGEAAAAAAEAAAVAAVDVAGEPSVLQQHEGLAQRRPEGRQGRPPRRRRRRRRTILLIRWLNQTIPSFFQDLFPPSQLYV